MEKLSERLRELAQDGEIMFERLDYEAEFYSLMDRLEALEAERDTLKSRLAGVRRHMGKHIDELEEALRGEAEG
jgi:predicted nuclease with TOPRIM domain